MCFVKENQKLFWEKIFFRPKFLFLFQKLDNVSFDLWKTNIVRGTHSTKTMHSNFVHKRNALWSWIRYGNISTVFRFTVIVELSSLIRIRIEQSVFNDVWGQQPLYGLVLYPLQEYGCYETLRIQFFSLVLLYLSPTPSFAQYKKKMQFCVWFSNAKSRAAINLSKMYLRFVVNFVHLCVS